MLVAIYNTWSDCIDLLKKSIENILPVVDKVIVVYSNVSNYGTFIEFIKPIAHEKVSYHLMDPTQKLNAHANETNKRNYGVKLAKEICHVSTTNSEYNYFIMMDSDEFYFQQDIINCRQYLEDNIRLNGLVARVNVLFKKPTLWVADHTLVPFIHKIQPNTQLGNFKHYPFTYDHKGDCHIDPTRRVNYDIGIEMCDVIMWHASWYRKDYDIKINNSAARGNLLKSSIFNDLEIADVGVYNQFYRETLKECENFFDL